MECEYKMPRWGLSSIKNRLKRKVKDKIEDEVEDLADDLVANITKLNKKITGKMINEFDAYKEKWESIASDPIEVTFLFLIACYNYIIDEKKGEMMSTLMLAKTFLLKDLKSQTGYKLNPKGDGFKMDLIGRNHNIIKSYLGGNPDNGYEIDENNLTMHLVGKGIEGENAKIFIQSGGKDFSTPIKYRKNSSGQWKIFSWGSIATGVKKTTKEAGDF